ncbi:transglycosylase SLT domain-containing protein [Bizionia myxarmorum]|uniref:Lytic transglycosylase domain-containing protein n=1 Tax=Bizionia myxarmorum TaxID=291186 RepID=A0A5D0RA29_9FLAO|nr:transglycosylase SLT domain-containing protein [Bizionia myxarmorum]TYB78337.1 lytic transglycosylase domain-containing protein [Bizionia myxarmorum]
MLIYQDKVPSNIRTAFIAKIKEVSSYLNIDPNWLMAVINFESAGTFSPSIENHITGATGLIQFMPNTAQSLGTTVSALSRMSGVQQLDYVKQYYNPYKTKIKSYIDLYFATFFPIAIGKAGNYVLQTSRIPPGVIATSNPIFDINKDGKITKQEVETVMLSRIPANLIHLVQTNKTISLFGVVVFAAAAYYGGKKLKLWE